MNVRDINLNLLRVFESTYRCGGMTHAAAELFTTQSAVSQSIKQLELSLDCPLFDRLGRKLVATEQGKQLYQYCVPLLEQLEEQLGEFLTVKKQVAGLVTLGVPIEYGNNVVLPELSFLGKKHPMLRFQIRYGHAHEMNRELLEGRLDFAIIDSFGMDRRIGQEALDVEHLALCAHQNYVDQKVSDMPSKRSDYFEFDYIDYVADAPVLRQWFEHHFKKAPPQLKIRATLMDVQGMARMIGLGLGLGVLPMHVVVRLRKQGEKMVIFNEKKRPLENQLSLAYLPDKTRSLAVEVAINHLLEKLPQRNLKRG